LREGWYPPEPLTEVASTVPVTAVVCTRDRPQLLEQVIGPLGAAVAAVPGAELVIVQQGDGDVEAVCRQAGVAARVVRDAGGGSVTVPDGCAPVRTPTCSCGSCNSATPVPVSVHRCGTSTGGRTRTTPGPWSSTSGEQAAGSASWRRATPRSRSRCSGRACAC